jgi:hypothetical protein
VWIHYLFYENEWKKPRISFCEALRPPGNAVIGNDGSQCLFWDWLGLVQFEIHRTGKLRLDDGIVVPHIGTTAQRP